MSGPPQRDRGIIEGINVTPLVDITLVLLIIFIVTAKIMVTPAVPLDLPKAASSEQVQVIFSVLLAPDGRVLVNGAPVASDQLLKDKASQALKETSELRAVIHADGAVPHRQVMRVIDLLKTAGINRIAFGAMPEEAQ